MTLRFLLLAPLLLAGCAPVADQPAQAVGGASATGPTFGFRVGALEAVALLDGTISAPNDGKTFGVGRPAADVATVLEANGLPTDVLNLSLQPLLVRGAGQVLLFDTGAGDASFAKGGNLPASLRAAGVAPAQVTDIFISHAHGDHIGGLVDASGALAFPNASVHLSAAEWGAMKASAPAPLIAAVTPRVQTFQPGAQIVPNVASVEVRGHTPGHSAYRIGSGADSLLYIGDSAHHHVISVQRPNWTIAFDTEEPVARASRQALLKQAAERGERIYAVHFPFPGLGRVRASGETFTWVPEQGSSKP